MPLLRFMHSVSKDRVFPSSVLAANTTVIGPTLMTRVFQSMQALPSSALVSRVPCCSRLRAHHITQFSQTLDSQAMRHILWK